MSQVRPWARLSINAVYSGLDELLRFGVPDPDNLEARLFARVLDPE
jgi:hypothetical protein